MGTTSRGGCGVDRISALPDELLLCILTRLGCIQAAARTGILSSRWRGLWTHLREISFYDGAKHPALRSSILDALDAIDAATELDRLSIDLMDAAAETLHIPAEAARVARWLRLASRRLAGEGELRLRIAPRWRRRFVRARELELPVCGRAAAIRVSISHFGLQPWVPAAGTFAALRVLRVACFDFRRLDLERVVTSQCPRLQELALEGLMGSYGVAGLSIRSGSLERLELAIRVSGRLVVETPRLVSFNASRCFYPRISGDSSRRATRIMAPKLEEVVWHSAYDSSSDQIVEAGRHLRLLDIKLFEEDRLDSVPVAGLLRRFDTVDKLTLHVKIPPETIEYASFLDDTIKHPECKTLKIILRPQSHAYASIVFHLLHKCSGIKRLVIESLGTMMRTCDSDCLCRLLDNQKSEGIVLDFLEEVNVTNFKGTDQEEVFLRLLLTCKAIPRVSIYASPEIRYALNMETCQKVASFSHHGTRFEFHGRLNGSYGCHVYTNTHMDSGVHMGSLTLVKR